MGVRREMSDPDQVFRSEMQQVLDEVYRTRERAAVREVYSTASTRLRLNADMLARLNRIPEGGYTKQEMVDAINELIVSRGGRETLDPPEAAARPRAVTDPGGTEPAGEEPAEGRPERPAPGAPDR